MKIGWLPGDGIGGEVLEAAKIVLDAVHLDADYVHGDIGWEFWKTEGNGFPERTVELLSNVDAALFGAITSKPVKAAEAELNPALKGKVSCIALLLFVCGRFVICIFVNVRVRPTPAIR